MKKQKGITIIALTITIIVILILAGVTIQTLTGDNGLLQKATTAKQANEEAKEIELIKLAVSSAQVAGEGTLTAENLNSELRKNFNNNSIEVNKVPVGWTYNGHTIYENGKVENKEILLPKEYQQVEYIESTGTSNTYMIIKIDPLSKIEQFEVAFKDPIVIQDNKYHFFPIFGTNNASDTRVSYKMDTGYLTGSFGNMGYSASNEYIKNQINKISGESGKIIINGNEYEITSGVNSNLVKYTGLLCVTNRGTTKVEPFYLKIKLYEFRLNNGNLLNLIPCYSKTTVIDVNNKQCSSGTIGMYDTVSSQFYTNQGTGEFIKGADV